MTWSDELAQEAQKWANHIASQGKLAHCPPQERKGQGENIACCKGKRTGFNQFQPVYRNNYHHLKTSKLAWVIKACWSNQS